MPSTTSNRTGKTYIIGAGVAGLLAADALNQLYQKQYERGSLPIIEVIDQSSQVGDKLTKGNGRSMAVTEGLIGAGSTKQALEVAFHTPMDEGGMLYPGFVASEADRRAISTYVQGAGASVQERLMQLAQGNSTDADQAAFEARNDALLRFGFANFGLWQDFAHSNPEIAAKAGLQMDQKFRIYECPDAAIRAHQEVAHLNRIGAEFGHPQAGRLLSAAEVVERDPSLADYFTSSSRKGCCTTLQPGGVVNGGILVEMLEAKLRAIGNVNFTFGVKVHGVIRDESGQVAGLKVLKQGLETQIGSAQDQFIFATGSDRLLSQATVVPQEIFPVAGTTITIPVDEEAVRAGVPFSRKSWKQDGVGPLVISPTFAPNDEFLAWLDRLDSATFNPVVPETQALEFLSPEFVNCFNARSVTIETLDPRCIATFNPDFVGAKAGRWEIRVGGLKFYPGKEEKLDLDHAGVRWALGEQTRKAMEFMPELMAHVLERELTFTPSAKGQMIYEVLDTDIAKLQPWTGARPMYDNGMAAVGACCENSFLITGTGSWGMACGLGNAAIVAQLVCGIDEANIQIGAMSSTTVADYLERVRPANQQSCRQENEPDSLDRTFYSIA